MCSNGPELRRAGALTRAQEGAHRMRLRLVEIEGTPEEIARLDIEHLLGHPIPAPAVALYEGAPSGQANGPDGNQLARILEREAPPGRALALLEQFFEAVTGWGDVSVVPSWRAGDPKRVSYLRVHRHPRTRGAFVYVFPGRLRLNFRLGSDAARGLTHAVAREVKVDNAYQVSLMLVDDETLGEALRLAELAYELVAAPA